MTSGAPDPTRLLHRALASDRVHSGYLLSGDSAAALTAALDFARALVCSSDQDPETRPCENCRNCSRSAGSAAGEGPIEIDGTGKRGPMFRHIGDHPDLFWVDRGGDSTRVRIGQVRALQNALRLGSHEGGRRVAVIADAEWLNVEAQNALLRLLEEPPEQTTLVLSTASAAGLLATIRSRCQRVIFPVALHPPLRGDDAPDEVRAIAQRLDQAGPASLPELLDWAEEFRGERARAAEQVQQLIATGVQWLRERTTKSARAGHRQLRPELEAFRALQGCRKDLAQRNANPQMVAERALFALHSAAAAAR